MAGEATSVAASRPDAAGTHGADPGGASKRTVSLVLGSGGARGLAHIGIIEWLESHGYSIQSISGSSMGALVGGIYAAGKLHVYADWVQALERTDVLRLLDFSLGQAGLFKGERFMTELKTLIGEYVIEDLPIAYTAVATDVDRGREIWISKGSLFDAVRASIAIPTILTPHEVDGRLLLDGGLINPVPIAPTLHDRTDLTIAVNLSGAVDPSLRVARQERRLPGDDAYHRRIRGFIDSLNVRRTPYVRRSRGYLDVITRSFETMQATIARLKIAANSPDVLITIPRNVCMFYEFYRAAEVIEYGRRSARDVLGRALPEK